MRCTSNNLIAPLTEFTKDFTITQEKLDCSTLLSNALSPSSINIPYLDGGPVLTKSYTDFFATTPITNCAVLGCNYGDSCGDTTSITVPNVVFTGDINTSTNPYTLSYD